MPSTPLIADAASASSGSRSDSSSHVRMTAPPPLFLGFAGSAGGAAAAPSLAGRPLGNRVISASTSTLEQQHDALENALLLKLPHLDATGIPIEPMEYEEDESDGYEEKGEVLPREAGPDDTSGAASQSVPASSFVTVQTPMIGIHWDEEDVGSSSAPRFPRNDKKGNDDDGHHHVHPHGSTLAKRRRIPFTTIPRAVFHIIKGNVGMGIFLLPTIYQEAGFVLSPIFSLLLGAMVIDCTVILIQCRERIPKDHCNSYSEVGEYIFGPPFRVVVDIFTVFGQVGICLLYVQLTAGVISEMLTFEGSFKVYVAAAIAIVLPLSFFSNNISLLAIFSGTAVMMVILCVVITLEESIRTLSSQGISSSIVSFGVASGWPLFFASELTVLEGICVVLPVRRSMSPEVRKNVFTGMIVKTLIGIVAVYLIYGMLGYLAYGASVHTSLVSAIPLGPVGDIARAAIAINVTLSCPLQFIPAIEIFDRIFGIPHEEAHKSKKGAALRVVIHAVIAVAALFVGPDAVGLVLAFVGSVAATSLSLTLPALMRMHVEYAVSHPTMPRRGLAYYKAIWTCMPITWNHIRCWIYVAIGVAITIVGLVTCVADAAILASGGGGGGAGESVLSSNATVSSSNTSSVALRLNVSLSATPATSMAATAAPLAERMLSLLIRQ